MAREHDEATGLLAPTRLPGFDHPAIEALIDAWGWTALARHERIGAAYDFVRDEVAFGQGRADDAPASDVLRGGHGQGDTEATPLTALLRALGVPWRLHGFTIRKALRRGAVPELVYLIAPRDILHSWGELRHDGRWIALEGFILDRAFLGALQGRFAPTSESLAGYGVGTDRLSAPGVEWTRADTAIQSTGIDRDLGLFDAPDDFYAAHDQAFGRLRGALYRGVIRHWMIHRAAGIRAGRIPTIPAAPTTEPRAGAVAR